MNTFIYTVVLGDTLWSLANKFNTTVQTIMELNGLTSDLILVGQQLLIPTEAVLEKCEYIVEGDTLALIAAEYGTTVYELMQLNNLTSNEMLCVDEKLRVPCEPTLTGVTRDSLTYLFCRTSDEYLSLISQTQNSIKTVCPDFFELDYNGNLVVAGPDKLNAKFINTLHNQNIKVVPFISNHWDRALGEKAIENRENLSTQIAEAVIKYNLDGIDNDIENVTHTHRDEYTDFMRLLHEKLPNKLVTVAVAANPNNWTTGWHGSYDYKALSNYADYLMIMAYDEHYFGSASGPISSSSFFNKSIQFALNEGVPKNKIIMGIPFFGRFWKDGESVGGYGIAARDVEYLLKNYQSTSYFDNDKKSAYVEVVINAGDSEPIVWGGRRLTVGTYKIWYDDEKATRYKLNVINGYDLRGAGSWALGQEKLSIWNFYTYSLNLESITPTLEIIPPPSGVPINSLNSPPSPGIISCISD